MNKINLLKFGLQFVVAVLSLIPAYYGLINAWIGAARFLPSEAINPLMDSQFRFQSAIYLGLALVIWWILPNIEKHTAIFRILILTIFLGGLARFLSYQTVGFANDTMFGGMILELAVPILIVWHNFIRDK